MIRVITVLERDPLTAGYHIANPCEARGDRNFSTEEFNEWLNKTYSIYEFVQSEEFPEKGTGCRWIIYRYLTVFQHEHPYYNQAPNEVCLLIKEVEI